MQKTLLSLAILAALTGCATTGHSTQNAANTPAPNAGEKKIVMVGHTQDVNAYIRAFDANKDGIVSAEENERQRRDRFDAMDTDKNGWVSLTEYVQEFHKYIAQMLADEQPKQDGLTEMRFVMLAGKDGTHITRAQYDKSGDAAYAQFAAGKLPEDLSAEDRANAGFLNMPTNHTRKGMLELYDRNSDGKLPREEYDEARAEQFKISDINGDGKLSRDEYATEYQQRLDKRIHDMTVRQIRQTRVRFGILDTNKNDRLEWDEFKATSQRMFDYMDRNKDGRVDAADAALPPPKREQ